jgi:hypothetical protein
MKSDDCERNGGGTDRRGCDASYRVPCIEREVSLQNEIDLILKNTYSMPQVTLQEQLKRQKRMGERTTKFTMEMI